MIYGTGYITYNGAIFNISYVKNTFHFLKAVTNSTICNCHGYICVCNRQGYSCVCNHHGYSFVITPVFVINMVTLVFVIIIVTPH